MEELGRRQSTDDLRRNERFRGRSQGRKDPQAVKTRAILGGNCAHAQHIRLWIFLVRGVEFRQCGEWFCLKY